MGISNNSTLKNVMAYCKLVHRVVCVRTRLEMRCLLQTRSDCNFPGLMKEEDVDIQRKKNREEDLLLHSLPQSIGNPCKGPVHLIVTVVTNTDNGDSLKRTYYNDTTLAWWLKMSTIHIPSCNYFRVVHKGRSLFLSSHKNKILQDLGIKDGDKLVIGGGCRSVENHCSPLKKALKSKAETEKEIRRRPNTVAARKKKPEPRHPHVLSDRQLAEQYKQEHSRAMNRAFEALGPVLKKRRNQLNELSLQKSAPKLKHHIPKRSNVPQAASQCLMLDECHIKKAGQVAYPILVGEVSNLYKTSKLLHMHLTTIDLHGCSKNEALEKLDNILPLWVDTVMRGSKPWVMRVDIICGRGTQILADAVKRWIRVNRHVANSPK